MRSRFLYAALMGSLVWAIAASAYAYRARDSAIRGWSHSITVAADRDRMTAALEELRARRETDPVLVEKTASEAERAKAAIARADATSTAFRDLWGAMVGDPEISDDLGFAKAVANELHQRVELGPENTEGRFTQRMSRAMLKQNERSYCGEFSVFLKENLMAAGIPARTVQLATRRYVSGDRPGDTHVTVETFIDDNWLIIDPTFNATFVCTLTGELVGIDAARQCIDGGGNVVADQHPATRAGRTVAEHEAEYDLKFADFLAYTMQADTVIEGRPVRYRGYPDDTWLRRAAAQYQQAEQP